MRPGEKLFEELLIGDDPQGTAHPRIMMAREVFLPWEEVEQILNRLMKASHDFDCHEMVEILKRAPTGFAPNGGVADLVWCNGNEDYVRPAKSAEKVRRLPL